MAKASRTNPEFQQQLGDKNLSFQLHTLDGKVARHFVVKDQRVTSKRGPATEQRSPWASRMPPMVSRP